MVLIAVLGGPAGYGVHAGSTPDSDGQKPRNDPRLQVTLTQDWRQPTIQDVLDRLQQATGVPLTAAEGIDCTRPVLGNLSVLNVRAWEVMQILAQAKGVAGRWEEVGGGYCLLAEGSGEAVQPARGRRGVGLPLVGLALLLLLVAGWLFTRSGRSRGKVAAAAGPASPQREV